MKIFIVLTLKHNRYYNEYKYQVLNGIDVKILSDSRRL